MVKVPEARKPNCVLCTKEFHHREKKPIYYSLSPQAKQVCALPVGSHFSGCLVKDSGVGGEQRVGRENE